MKRRVILLALVSLIFTHPAYCLEDICEVAEAALTMTSAQMKEFLEDELKGWTYQGTGRIYDILQGAQSTKAECTVILDCRNDVFITIHAGDMWGSKKDLQVGQEISFSGRCKTIRRQFYRDSDKPHIMLLMESDYLQY